MFAGGAIGSITEILDAHLSQRPVPDIDHCQGQRHRVPPAGQNLQRGHRLQGRDDIDSRPKDTGRVAGLGRARIGWRFDQAPQTGRLVRKDRHRLSVTADAAGIDPGDSGFE